MPDRLVFSRVGLEHLELFSFEGGLEWLFDELGLEEDGDYERELLGCCTNVKAGEDEPATTYFLERVVLDSDRLGGMSGELLGCTCPAFRYQQVPKPAHVDQGVVGFENIGECKHLEQYRKRTRSYAAKDDSQLGLEDMLTGGSSDDGVDVPIDDAADDEGGEGGA